MHVEQIVVSAPDGPELFVRFYRTHRSQPVRTLMIVHGASEHGGQYDHLASVIAQHDWNVVVTDLRGHGRSGGIPMHVRSFRQYVSDLEAVREYFQLEPRQTAMLGHSVGGLIALRYSQSFPENLAALVLMSPLLSLAVPIPRRLIAVGKMLSIVAPRTRFRSRIDPYDTTRNLGAVECRLNDPLVHRSVTAGWYFAMKLALRRVWDQADMVRLPVLVMQAGDDRIVDPNAPQPWLETVGSQDTTLHLIPHNLHELHNEPDWRDTTSKILVWLHDRISGTDVLGNPVAV